MPPIPAQSLLVFLLQVGLLLLVAIVLGRLADRLGMPAIVGELSAGVLLLVGLTGVEDALGAHLAACDRALRTGAPL